MRAVLCCVVAVFAFAPAYTQAKKDTFAEFLAAVAETELQRRDAVKNRDAGRTKAIDEKRKALASGVVGAAVTVELRYMGSTVRSVPMPKVKGVRPGKTVRAAQMDYTIQVKNAGPNGEAMPSLLVKLTPESEAAVYDKIGSTAKKGDAYRITGKIVSCPSSGSHIRPVVAMTGVEKIEP